ncbi:LysR family transcriptional regulator [Breoghania sp. L-A4]|uniref:LysR family transcriptional regulator n=1 Tax=Breoghania sp. L-A4 TaxID=2304600 RepID=UPI000E35DE78|nr:LysR family transcriptional regulator [Breoghania sp. L-A4]AXS39387.1 LysR family transcriptional regulator [Breoghania sp. L-A4]
MAYALDIDQLRTFVAIAELGSFTRAAEAVNKTQSAVSMQMRRLEERVGQPIFARDGRQSRLTENGHRLQEYARRLIRLNDETLSAFSDPDLVGRISLGLPDDYAERLLPQMLSGFARINPSIEVVVECFGSVSVAERVSRGELDIGIVTSCEDTFGQGDIIRREQLHWVGASDRCLQDDEVLRLALASEPCAWRKGAMDALDGIARPYCVAYTSGNSAVLSSAARAGLAVTVMPESALRPGLRTFDERDGMPPLPVCDIALLRSARATESVHNALCDHIVASIGNISMQMAAE